MPVHRASSGHHPAGRPAPEAMPSVYHPKPDDEGAPVILRHPSTPTGLETWLSPQVLATTTPRGPVPASLHGLDLEPWRDAPTTTAGWLSQVPPDLAEPPPRLQTGKSARGRAITVSGVICQEPDGRIWIVHPSNGFAGYQATFPKGKLDPGLTLAANAIKEAWEETGLQVRLLRFLFDIDRQSSWARYYLARRIGGSPADMGWESQAVSLCPIDLLAGQLNNPRDHGTATRLSPLEARDC